MRSDPTGREGSTKPGRRKRNTPLEGVCLTQGRAPCACPNAGFPPLQSRLLTVIPAKAGIHFSPFAFRRASCTSAGMKRRRSFTRTRKWIPAFAGMTNQIAPPRRAVCERPSSQPRTGTGGCPYKPSACRGSHTKLFNSPVFVIRHVVNRRGRRQDSPPEYLASRGESRTKRPSGLREGRFGGGTCH